MSDTITLPTPRLAVGQPAPDFTLPATGGGTFALTEHRGGRVIVYLYPAAMTPGCTTQACDFRDSLASLTASGYTVAGVSPAPWRSSRPSLQQKDSRSPCSATWTGT